MIEGVWGEVVEAGKMLDPDSDDSLTWGAKERVGEIEDAWGRQNERAEEIGGGVVVEMEVCSAAYAPTAGEKEDRSVSKMAVDE